MPLAVRNRAFLVADLLAWTLLPLVALGLRFDGVSWAGSYWPRLTTFTLLALAAKLSAFWLAGLYRRNWRYASIDELALIVVAVFAAELVAGFLYFFLAAPLAFSGSPLPPAVPIIDAMLTLLVAGGMRFAARVWEHTRSTTRGAPVGERVLIIGAGDAGAMLARDLRAHRGGALKAVGFIDDDPTKRGSTIHGLRVLGDRDDIPAIAQDYGVTEAIIAMPTVTGAVIREIRDICDAAKLHIKVLPRVFEIFSTRVGIDHLREVQIEDLLRRQPVVTDQRAVAELVAGLSVLVTGAGGSIGSEICRQIALLGARRAILLGHGENSIFDVHNELRARYPDLEVVPVLADIRDAPRMRHTFEAYRPDAVFHAAAHKHVPLMELNPEEAVTNNVGGTATLVDAAEATDVRHFVLISTDKAVNPANIMGATKLVAERVVHDAALRTGRGFVSVRFGNVLASRGSVVPVFQDQIRKGGPITVTHPDMSRYFMTIPEAVQLVLQAAAMGRGGETFVLDMGEPVKILQLARDLIRLSGLEPDRDIKITFSGLRPGEKLDEELFSQEEAPDRTWHEKIFVVRNGATPPLASGLLTDLVRAAGMGDRRRMAQRLREVVPGYAGGLVRREVPGMVRERSLKSVEGFHTVSGDEPSRDARFGTHRADR